jgi:hypothetical protein
LRFTVRRPPTGEVSPCCHRPSGGDVACSVDVGVAPASRAGLALEDRLALAVSGSDVPARRASLRRVSSRHLLDPAQRLVLQACDDLTPATSTDRTVEPTLLSDTGARSLDGAARGSGHRPHVQSLDPDYLEPPSQVSGRFLHPILTPIPLTGFQLRDRPFDLVAAFGTTPAAGQPLLQHLQPLGLTRGQTGCVQQFAGGQRGRHGNSAVDTDKAAITWTRDRVGDVGERDMPAASPITGNPVGLNTLWHRPRQPKPHPPDLRHPHPTETAIQPLDMMWLHGDLPKPLMHTGLTPPRAAMCAGEEVPHGLREIAQRLLLDCLTSGSEPGVLGAGLRQLRGLLQIAGSLAARLPMLLLLHRQIPHIPRVAAVRQQCLLLLRSRQQAKPRHIRTLATGTDISRPSATVPVVIGFLLELKSRASSPKETSMRRKRAAVCCTDVISAVELSSRRTRGEGQSN